MAAKRAVKRKAPTDRAAYTVKLDRTGLNILLRRGFSVRELAEIFQISRPTVQSIIDGEPTPTISHPGITLFVNARIKELIEKTTV